MRGGLRFGWVFAAVWLFYLLENLNALLDRPAGWAKVLGLAGLAGFAVAYLAAAAVLRRIRFGGLSRLPVWWMLLVLSALFAMQLPGAGQHALPCLTYLSAVAVMGLPVAAGVSVAGALVVGAELVTWLVPGWADNGYGLAALLGGVATYGIRLATERQQRLAATQKELAELAVHNERARIASELHDILGHSLTVVTVKAELAQRLLDVDLDRARKELAELEGLARDALSDVRATALGVRGISLPGEIAAARVALAAANVQASLPGAADEVPTALRELFAWTIREAVTNIVRHAGASRAEVRLGPRSVEIIDDGAGPPPDPGGPGPRGQGLRGLRRRAEELGGTLVAGARGDRPGFRVRVEVP